MKSYTFLLIFCFISYSLAENTYLVRMEWDRSVPEHFTVVHYSQSQCLVLANETQMQQLRRSTESLKLLQTNPHSTSGAEYFAVFPDTDVCGRIDPAIFARYGTVIDVFDGHLVMKGNAEELLSNTECAVTLKHISLQSSLNPYRVRTVIKREPVQFDPLIEQIIENVNADSCADLLRDLCGIYNRFADEKYNIEEVVPFIENKFLAYNCDTVFRLAVSGYDAPAVVGIKWGEENQSLDRVCVIGAHPDNYSKDGGRHQGAWDNGDGNVGYLEAARAMKDFTFTNTICFVGFNAEEKGLKGSMEFVEFLEDNGSEILGGAITYDMLGFGWGTSTAGSHTISTANTGGQEFADKMEEICGIYNVPVSVSTTSSNEIPTDTENFWQNGFVASCGKGGQGPGVFHEKGDSITSIFDSTWLALAVTPGIATIAYYAEPIGVTAADFVQQPVFTNPILINTSHSGFVSITLSDSRLVPHQTVSIYTVSGKLVQTLVLSKRTGSKYSGVWDYRNPRGYAVGRGLYLITGTINNKRFQKKVVISR